LMYRADAEPAAGENPPYPRTSKAADRVNKRDVCRTPLFWSRSLGGHLCFVELIVLVDVEVAHFLMLDPPGGAGRSDVPRKNATLMYFVKQWKLRKQPRPSTP